MLCVYLIVVVSGCVLFVVCCLLFVVAGCSLFVVCARCFNCVCFVSGFVVCYVSFVVIRCSLVVVHRLLFVDRWCSCLLFVVC